MATTCSTSPTPTHRNRIEGQHPGSLAKEPRVRRVIAVALITGLRRGEALGLSWDDVDFGAGTLHVRHSLQRVDGALLLTETKSKASTGYVPAPPSLLKILGRHKAQQQAERLALGERWPDTGLVFTSTTGTACEPRNVSRDWERLRAQAGLPQMRLHDLRHATATILTALGIHPRVIMEMMRHSQIAVTMNVYSHVMPSLSRQASDALETALFG